MTHAITTYIVS